MQRVRIHADVLESLREQRRWLAERRDERWAARLREDLEEALDVLAEYPLIGETARATERKRAGSETLRRLPLRRTPFVLWYVVRHDANEVWVLRLFHARQARSVAPPRGRRRR